MRRAIDPSKAFIPSREDYELAAEEAFAVAMSELGEADRARLRSMDPTFRKTATRRARRHAEETPTWAMRKLDMYQAYVQGFLSGYLEGATDCEEFGK